MFCSAAGSRKGALVGEGAGIGVGVLVGGGAISAAVWVGGCMIAAVVVEEAGSLAAQELVIPMSTMRPVRIRTYLEIFLYIEWLVPFPEIVNFMFEFTQTGARSSG